MLTTVAICTFNRAASLRRTLEALVAIGCLSRHLMDWIEGEAVWFFCPDAPDVAAIKASRKHTAVGRSAFSSNATKANLAVRSIATKRELALLGAHLGDVDVEVADRVCLELALLRPVPFHLRQARDAVPLQAAGSDERVRCAIVVCKAIEAVIGRR
jgi:hypothetical protein